MRAIAIFVVLAIAVLAIVGYSRDWFHISTQSNEHSTTYSVTVDKIKWQADRDDFRKETEAKLKVVDAKIADLQARLMQVGTETREQMVKTIDSLHRQEATLKEELKSAGDTTHDRWESLKGRISRALGDLEEGAAKAMSRFKSEKQ